MGVVQEDCSSITSVVGEGVQVGVTTPCIGEVW
jgi:hypothetical protein